LKMWKFRKGKKFSDSNAAVVGLAILLVILSLSLAVATDLPKWIIVGTLVLAALLLAVAIMLKAAQEDKIESYGSMTKDEHETEEEWKESNYK